MKKIVMYDYIFSSQKIHTKCKASTIEISKYIYYIYIYMINQYLTNEWVCMRHMGIPAEGNCIIE